MLSLVGLLLVLAGCESPAWVRALNESFSMQPGEKYADEARCRREYAANRDREAMRWLLRNRIESGMSYGDVCKTLGEEGVREVNDNWVKSQGGNYQVGDDVYAFGPDNAGQTIYLVFRDDHLVNFDPKEFSGPARRRSERKRT